MKSKKNDWGILVRVLLLFLTLLGFAFALLRSAYLYDILLIPFLIWELVDFYKLHKKAQNEVDQFVESIHYRDFSRHFNVKQAPPELQNLREGFNEINSTFKVISKEKETQFQYLQKVLELVDTGILSYEIKTGEVIWMNESLKKLLQIPYLKTIQSLDKRDPELCFQIVNVAPGEKFVITIHQDKNKVKVVASATAFQTEGMQYKLLAFQNVSQVLDETESKAWQKLLSVMTHEIMNSVAPISSLANTLQVRLKQVAKELNVSADITEDLELGIDTIKKRSEGLLKFTETYRNLNKITKANLSKVYISELFENIQRLMQPTLDQKNICLSVQLKDPLICTQMDVGLIEQVLINLILNAIDAVKGHTKPQIHLSAYTEAGNKVIIKITDNGYGMSEDVLDKIFVPFFSTKKSGNGIGLSLCKQIMMVHKGSIQVHSILEKGTVFTLSFYNFKEVQP
jgi:nitrogen fixation/metabolism regulation signal transduction histidine kinase